MRTPRIKRPSLNSIAQRAKNVVWETGVQQDAAFPLLAEKYQNFESQLESHLTNIVAYWLADAFSKSELCVKEKGSGEYITGHEVEMAYEFPSGGKGPFWRGVTHDYIHHGLWFHRYNKPSAGRREFKVSWLPRNQVKIPGEFSRIEEGNWYYDPPYAIGKKKEKLNPNLFSYGVWDLDPNNPYGGLSPLRKVRNILNLDKAALRYEFDAFLHAGGQGLLIKDPSMANRTRFNTHEEFLQFRVMMQEFWTMQTTGEGRSRPVVTDTKDTEIGTYGVDISKIDMWRVYSFTAEMILAVFSIPPSAIGIRLDRDPTYANSRTWETVAFERGVLPRQKEIAERLTSKLLTQAEIKRGLRLEFKTPDALRAELEDRGLLERILHERVNRGTSIPSEVRPLLKDVPDDDEVAEKLDERFYAGGSKTVPGGGAPPEGNQNAYVDKEVLQLMDPDPAVQQDRGGYST